MLQLAVFSCSLYQNDQVVFPCLIDAHDHASTAAMSHADTSNAVESSSHGAATVFTPPVQTGLFGPSPMSPSHAVP